MGAARTKEEATKAMLAWIMEVAKRVIAEATTDQVTQAA